MAHQSISGRGGNRASADNDSASLIFGPQSDSNVSHIVQVEHDPIVVKAYNLTDGDEVRVEMVDGDGAGSMFAPFCPFDGQSTLTHTRTVLPIGIPGRYRFVLQRSDGGTPPLGLVLVRAHPAQMSHDWLIAYLRCNGG
ncbi:hypothetical protein WI84_16320 [Burkholderia ubonensis]|uniref:hypothetical protein n=1 Tax=Burkholderia ubonensis TaxID=101571 RepID=UPI0007550B5C|nr:hypothetical protein [Burkholderia ubonensis]KVD35434.1 hypothetical protein WI84_16320 [Burkholderia ubonensis]